MISEHDKVCGTCEFWEELEEKMWGHCMRFPPVHNGSWAVVKYLLWCGEFKKASGIELVDRGNVEMKD